MGSTVVEDMAAAVAATPGVAVARAAADSPAVMAAASVVASAAAVFGVALAASMAATVGASMVAATMAAIPTGGRVSTLDSAAILIMATQLMGTGTIPTPMATATILMLTMAATTQRLRLNRITVISKP